MKPRRKGNRWEITYRCPGYSKIISERFDTYEEAKARIEEIEYEKKIGELRPPVKSPEREKFISKKFITVSEFLDEYVKVYGLNHWGASYLSNNRHRIEHYIKPYIGSMMLRDLTTHDLDVFYNRLLDEPAVVLKGHKQTDKTVTPSVIQKIHVLLRGALNQAVAWGYLTSNPAQHASPPEYIPAERVVWSEDDAASAIELCNDPILQLTLLLAIGGTLRIGEVLGLTWDCVDLSDSMHPQIKIDKELARLSKEALEELKRRDRSKIKFEFPNWKKKPSSTVLVLKDPKTESSKRHIYLAPTVGQALADMKAAQEQIKELCGEAYTDYGLVIAQDTGRPYERGQIAYKLDAFIQKVELPSVVFHSLRHFSTTLKLQLSNGDIKAVQGDTGHAQARMVTDQYAHITDRSRQNLAQQVDVEFFQKIRSSDSPASPSQDKDMQTALQLVQADLDLAKLIVALKGSSGT